MRNITLIPSTLQQGLESFFSGQCWLGLLTEELSWTLGKGQVFGGKTLGQGVVILAA